MTNNREIKFRGFHIDENGKEKVYVNGEWVKGYWVYGVPVFEEDRCYIIQNLFICDHCYLCTGCVNEQVIPETVGQYTGLKDKDGKEIFEGDILHVNYHSEKDVTIVWDDGAFHFKAINRFLGCLPGELLALCCIQKEVEVYKKIGNIYENPELLEVK